MGQIEPHHEFGEYELNPLAFKGSGGLGSILSPLFTLFNMTINKFQKTRSIPGGIAW